MKKTIFLIITSCFAQISNAYTPLKDFTQGSMELGAYTEYFRSEENYKSGGGKESLPSGFSYQLIDININSRFVIGQDFALYASANIGSSESKSSTDVYTNSTLNWVEVGGDYLLLNNGDLSLVFDLSAIVPLEKISDNMETSLNWDGAFHVRPRGIISYETNGFVPYASLGVDYRDKGLSTLATFSAGLSSSLKSDFVFGGELNGYTTIGKDSLASDKEFERTQIIDKYNASSKKFYSINPSLFDTEIYFKYRVQEWSVGASGGMTLSGSQSASGFHAKLFVTWNMGKINNHASSSHFNRSSGRPDAQAIDVDETIERDLLQSVEQRPVAPAQLPASSQKFEKEIKAADKASREAKPNKEYQLKLKKVKPAVKKKKTP